MHFVSTSVALVGFVAVQAYAAPTNLQERSVTTLSASDLSSLAPFTQFARAAYCDTGELATWSCGGKWSMIDDM
ncbi:hypothetical protein CPC08DRAFT_703644 [Agrocybe pediades]|nr:hypothetical protein CPC08DRAFT_703644 [Agrocybe pediades]